MSEPEQTDAIDWWALKVLDPDPEPFAIGEGCDVFIRHPQSGAEFDCTRSPHEGDLRHVSCAWWGAMTAADAIVVAIWTDAPEGSTIAVEAITPEQFAAIDARFRQ